MSFANNTPITVPDGKRAISELAVGDTVLAWTPNGTIAKQVIFSSGTGDQPQGTVVFIRFERTSLIATPDQPMILADNTAKRADRLIPGADRLLGENGQPVNIDMVSLGRYAHGAHHIGIDKFERTGDHLIIANGIVCADYIMQVMPPFDDRDDLSSPAEEAYK